jgi:hypothetical protein
MFLNRQLRTTVYIKLVSMRDLEHKFCHIADYDEHNSPVSEYRHVFIVVTNNNGVWIG